MRTITPCSLIILALLLPQSTAAQEQQATQQSNYDLHRIASSLERIVGLLSDQTQVLRSSLLMDRLRLETDELLSAELALERALEQRDGIDAQIRQITAEITSRTERIRLSTDSLSPELEKELDALQIDYEARLVQLEQELSSRTTRLISAENRVRGQELQRDATRRQLDEILDLEKR